VRFRLALLVTTGVRMQRRLQVLPQVESVQHLQESMANQRRFGASQLHGRQWIDLDSDYPNQISVMPGYTRLHRADFKKATECNLYSAPFDRDRSLRNETNYLLYHEERRANTINIMLLGELFIPNFPIRWQE